MTLKLEDRYPSQSTPANAYYPGGSFRNRSAPGLTDGTPLEIDWSNDKEGLRQALLVAAGIEANGVIDTAIASQQIEAMRAMMTGGPAPVQATLQDICSGPWAAQWQGPESSPNYVTTGITIRDACLAIDHGGTKRPIIYVLDDDESVYPLNGVWDYSGAPALGTPLSFNISGDLANVDAICSDGDSLYVIYRTVSSSDVKISKFDLVTFTGTPVWTRNTGEARTNGYIYGARLCVADADNIGFVLPTTASSPYQLALGVVAKDNSTFEFDAFEVTPGGNDIWVDSKMTRMVSDGTEIYAIGYRNDGGVWVNYMCQAEISDTSAQTVTAIVTTADTFWQAHQTGIAAVRDMVVTVSAAGSVYGVKSGISDWLGLFDNFVLDISSQHGVPMFEDGQNLYFGLVEDIEFSSPGLYNFMKMPAGEFVFDMRKSTPETFYSKRVRIPYQGVGHLPSSPLPVGRFIFDRRDLWFLSYNGWVYRISNPGGI